MMNGEEGAVDVFSYTASAVVVGCTPWLYVVVVECM